MRTYRIADEPEPSPIAHLAVDPIWPMFSVMFAGPWLAWPWFAFNAAALGSPSRHRTLAIASTAVALSYAAYFGIVFGQDAALLADHLVAYGWIAVTALQLGACYVLYLEQSRTHELFHHFRGRSGSGLLVLLLGALARPWVSALPALLPLVLR
jgi:hypothetical protein